MGWMLILLIIIKTCCCILFSIFLALRIRTLTFQSHEFFFIIQTMLWCYVPYVLKYLCINNKVNSFCYNVHKKLKYVNVVSHDSAVYDENEVLSC